MAGDMAEHEAKAANAQWRHGVAPFGDLKYASGFKRLDYVNPEAPKGGSVKQIALGTFDSFNLVVAGIKGAPATGLDMIYDTLLAQSLDEVASGYGLIAEAISFPADMSWVAFRLRPQARWHDGAPITVDDVLFSFAAFKKYNPQAGANYRHVAKAEKTGDHEVTFGLDPGAGRDLPQLLGQLTVLPKHWWQGAGKDGKKRNVGDTTLEPPLGSGPYHIKEFSPGRSITYERVNNYWARDLNINVGTNNFDELRFDYFFDASVAVQAFKANTIDWRIENSAKNWATEYTFPAAQEKRVILEQFPINNVGIMQAFAFNIRRDKFKDPRVRLAFNHAFNFEEMNRQIFFGQYERITSYFQGTDLASSGLPSQRELALLEPLRDRIPAEVFKSAYSNPAGGNEAQARDNMRDSLRLFKAAGYVVRDQQLVNAATGEPYSVEFIGDNRLFERVFLFYKPWLERLGIERDDSHHGRAAVREPVARLGFRYRHLRVGRDAVARQRTARLLGFAGGGSARLGKRDRNQEQRRGHSGRQSHCRQQPCRSSRRREGSRSRAAVELLRRAAMELQQIAHGSMGPFQPPAALAGIRHVGVPESVVVGPRQGGEDWAAGVIERGVGKAGAGRVGGGDGAWHYGGGVIGFLADRTRRKRSGQPRAGGR